MTNCEAFHPDHLQELNSNLAISSMEGPACSKAEIGNQYGKGRLLNVFWIFFGKENSDRWIQRW
jgi:hypothetical protein